MTFADEIEKVASERFSLVRLEPARQIDGIWTDIGGGLFEYDFTEQVSRILENGTTLTKVSSTPAVGQWSQDETTKKVTVYPVSGSNTIIMFYYVLYTIDYDRIFPDEVTSGSDVCWNGRILTDPSITQSIKNIASSFTLTSTTSNLSVANNDNVFQGYLTGDDSFANKNADSWIVVNSEIQKVFTGKITSISIGIDTINIGLNDSFNIAVSETAYLGEPIDEALTTESAYPGVLQSHKDKPIPMIFGRTNHFDVSGGDVLNEKSKYKALNIDTTTSGLDWVLCRIPDTVSLKTGPLPGFTSPETVPQVTFIRQVNVPGATTTIGCVGINISLTGDQREFIDYGDTFEYTTADGTFDAVVTRVSFSGGLTAVFFYSEQTASTDPAPGPTFTPTIVMTSASFTANPTIMVGIPSKQTNQGLATGDLNSEPSDFFLPLPNKHYTTSIVSQTNSKLIKISFKPTWYNTAMHSARITTLPTTFDGDAFQYWTPKTPSEFDHNTKNVFWKIHTDDVESNHSDALKFIVDKSGIPVDDASFALAKSELANDILFSVPFAGQNTLGTLKNYIQAILKSTIGSIFIDENGIVNYRLFDTPVLGDKITDDRYLKGSLQTSLSYRDILSKISFNNIHQPVNSRDDSVYDSRETTESNKAKYLHETESTDFFDHVLKRVTDNSRYLKLLDLRSERFVTYKYTTSSTSLLDNILDNITINDARVLGGSGSANSKIVAFTKDDDKVTITVSDLLGL